MMDGIDADRVNWVVNHLLGRGIRCERCNCAYDDVHRRRSGWATAIYP